MSSSHFLSMNHQGLGQWEQFSKSYQAPEQPRSYTDFKNRPKLKKKKQTTTGNTAANKDFQAEAIQKQFQNRNQQGKTDEIRLAKVEDRCRGAVGFKAPSGQEPQ